MDNSKKLEVIVRALELKANKTDIDATNKKTLDLESLIKLSVGKVDATPNEDSHGEIFNNYEGYNQNEATGSNSHAEGSGTIASGICSHAEGRGTTASGDYSHAENNNSEASGYGAHSEGSSSIASGDSSHAEGHYSNSIGETSHAEGQMTNASGIASHTEGHKTAALGDYSHAEGDSDDPISIYDTVTVTGESTFTTSSIESYKVGSLYCFDDGWDVKDYLIVTKIDTPTNTITVDGIINFTDGEIEVITPANISYGTASHTEGFNTQAIGNNAHAEGDSTIAANYAEHSLGSFNTIETSPVLDMYEPTKTIFVIGNGTDDASRSDALKMLGNGTMWIAGIGDFTGTNPTDLNSLLAIITNLLKQITDLQAKIK